MKKKEMMSLVLDWLGQVLSGTDFRIKKSEDAFVRTIAEGRQLIGVPMWDYHPEFVFSLNICIRLEQVERVVHLFSGSPNAKYQAMSFTTITTLEHFVDGTAKYRVSTQDDLVSIGTELTPIVQGKIIPFLDEHMDVSSLDRAVNGQQPGIDISVPPWGAVHSVILAHLAGNPDFNHLVAKHREDLKIGVSMDHPFNRVVAHLHAR